MTVIGSAYVNIRAITDKLESDIRSSLESITDSISIHVDADVSSATAKLDELANTTLDDQTIKVDADTTQASADLRTVWSESFNATIHAEADTLEARRELDDMMDDIGGRTAHPTILPHVNNILANIQMAVLTRVRSAEIIVKTNEASLVSAGTAISALSGGRPLWDKIDTTFQKLKNLDKAVPGISKLSLAIGGVSSVLLSSIAGLFTFGASLISIANMGAIVLPGMLSGFVVGFASLFVALKDFSKQLPEVAAQYKTLGATIKENFWDKARDPIREISQQLFPQFQKGLADTGSALGRWSATLVEVIGSSLQMNGRLSNMFGFLTSSIDKARIGSAAAADTLIVLGEAGGSVLPRLADWFTEISVRFNTFIKGAAASGELQQWIDDGITNLKTLWQGLSDLAGIFSNITEAAKIAGSDGLQTFANTMSKLNDLTGSSSFITNMAEIFRGAGDGAASIGDGLMVVVKALGDAAPAISSIMSSAGRSIEMLGGGLASIISNPAFQGGMVAMFAGIESGVSKLAPALEVLAPKMGEIGKVIGTFADVMGGVFAEAINLLMPALVALGPVIEPLIKILGEGLVNAMKLLQPVFDELVPVITELGPPLAELATKLVALLLPAIEAIVPVLKTAVENIGVALKFIIESAINVVDLISALFKGDFMAVFGLLGKQIADALFFIADFFDNMFGTDIRGFITDFGAWWMSFWDGVAKGWTDFWGGFGGMMGDLFGGIGKWFDDIGRSIDDFFGGFGKGAGEASGAVGGFFDGIGATISGALGAAGDWFAGIGRGISDAFNGVVDFISNIIDTIVSVISTGVQIYISIWTTAFGIIADVFKNIWNGIVWFFQPIVDLIIAIITGTIDIIMAVWTAGWEIIGTIFYGIWINLQRFFEPILQGISDFISNTVNTIVTVWNTTWQAISDFFAAIWNGLVAFYAPILQGIWDFIVAVGAGISLAWNTAWQAIGDFFTTIWNNMVAFYAPILQSIWDFIVAVGAGIAATWNAVWQGISDFFTGLWNGIVSFVQGAVQNVSSVITNVVNNISAGWNATWSAISNYVSQVWSGIVSSVSGFVGEVQRNVQNVLDTIGRIGSDIVSNVSNFGNLLISAGRDLINGLTQGIENSSGAVVEKIKSIAAGALDAIKSFFGIKSPSRVMRDQVGKQLGLGLAIGIEASIGAVLKATDKLAAAAVPDIADIMLPAVKTASMASQRGTTASVTSPALTRASVTGSPAASDGTGVFGQSNNGGITNVNFSVNPSPGLNETQIGESAMNYMYWKLSNHSLG